MAPQESGGNQAVGRIVTRLSGAKGPGDSAPMLAATRRGAAAALQESGRPVSWSRMNRLCRAWELAQGRREGAPALRVVKGLLVERNHSGGTLT